MTNASDVWDNNFNSLKIFYSEHGRYPDINSKDEKEVKLSRWVQRQRNIYNNGVILKDGSRKLGCILQKDQILKLKIWGFIFDVYRANWEINYKKLVDFVSVNKRIPNASGEEAKLRSWYRKNAKVCLEGVTNKDGSMTLNRTTLTQDEVLRIRKYIPQKENLKPKKTPKRTDYIYMWEKELFDFKKFLRTYKRYPNIDSENEEERNLAKWFDKELDVYTNGELLPNGAKTLNGHTLTKKMQDAFAYCLNNHFVFNNSWDSNFEKLKKFLEEKNRYPDINVKEEHSLALWVIRQRTTYNNGYELEDGSIKYAGYILTKENIDKLKSIGFVFVSNEKNYQGTKWTNKEKYLIKLRYLKDRLEVLTKENKKIKSKEDINELNRKYKYLLEGKNLIK